MSTPRPEMADLFAKVLDMLLSKHPRRTCLGVLHGAATAIIIAVLAPRSGFEFLAPLGSVHVWQWVAIGVLLAHALTIHAFFRPQDMNGLTTATLDAIEKAPFSEEERRMMHRRLSNAVMQSLMNRAADGDSR